MYLCRLVSWIIELKKTRSWQSQRLFDDVNVFINSPHEGHVLAVAKEEVTESTCVVSRLP